MVNDEWQFERINTFYSPLSGALMPPMKRVTVTVSSETSLTILRYLKEVKHLSPEKAIDAALKLLFDER